MPGDGVCGDTGAEYEISKTRKRILGPWGQLQADAAVQLWQWQRERRLKINIILETLVIHFLSHLAYCPPLLEFPFRVTEVPRAGGEGLLRFGPPAKSPSMHMCSLGVTIGFILCDRDEQNTLRDNVPGFRSKLVFFGLHIMSDPARSSPALPNPCL